MEIELIKDISNNKYKIKNKTKIGGGAFSKVFTAQCNKKDYAAKIYNEETKYDAAKELNILNKIKLNKENYLSHVSNVYGINVKSNLLDVNEYFIKDEYNIILIMDKYPGTLDSFVEEYNNIVNKPLDIKIVDKICFYIFNGLMELKYNKLIHCDIKPDNILIGYKNEKTIESIVSKLHSNKISISDFIDNLEIKIIDFNKALSYDDVLKSTSIQTLYYSSPEIILGNRNYDYSIDLWSTACIIYELLTSKYLFDLYNYNSLISNNESESESESSNESESESESESDSSNESDTYTDSDNLFENLGLLNLYDKILGTNDFIDGRNVDKFYTNGILIGTYCKCESKLEKYISGIPKKYKDLLLRILKYNYNNRVSIEELFQEWK